MPGDIGLEIKGVHKKFPGVYALNNVSFNAYKREVLGLVGVNGAGKSTLMNIIGGLFKQDSGEILIDGESVKFSNPIDAEKAGIAFIQQEIQLFYNLRVFENVFLMSLDEYKRNRFLPLLDKKQLCQETNRYLSLLGCVVDPKVKVEYLSVGEQQMVQIARSLSSGGKVLLFDEPTSSLSFKEKEKLFEVIRNLRDSNHTIIFISHYLDEVQKICDRVVVLRDGIVSGHGSIEEMSKEKITSHMMPEEVKFEGAKHHVSKEVVLRVKDLSGYRKPKKLSFDLHKGEVLGLWGLLGSGRTETIRAILGYDDIISGKIYYSDGEALKEINRKSLLKESGYLTESRHYDGLFLSIEIWKNITSANLKKYTRTLFSILDSKKEKEDALSYIKKLRIAAVDQFVKVAQLSGGNQQKVAIGKWLSKDPKLLFLDEPTRGVDVGAKIEIQNLIRGLADRGISCIVISSELEEIQNLCDSVVVMRKGEAVSHLQWNDMSNKRLLKECIG